MSSDVAFEAERRLLGGLAELSLLVVQDVQAAISATDDSAQIVRLVDAFAKAGRCLRMSIALSMRLAKGDALTPAREARDLDLEADLEADERDDFDFEDERPERETLYDRLPAGDAATQIAAVAHTLRAATRSLPAPLAEAYRIRCEALVANAAAFDTEPTRARGPPRFG